MANRNVSPEKYLANLIEANEIRWNIGMRTDKTRSLINYKKQPYQFLNI